MALNPNFPVMDYAMCWAAGPTSNPVQSYWSSVLERTRSKVSGERGKTYELDQAQSGEVELEFRNDDGMLDPTNEVSIYAPYVVPYRMFRIRAQWPPTPNMLTADQATAFYATKGSSGAGSTLPQWVGQYNATVTVGYSAPLGTNYYNVSLAASQVGNVNFVGWSVSPNQTYTLQGMSNASTTSVTVAPEILWLDVNGNQISNSVGTAVAVGTGGGTLLTVTATAPVNACGAIAYFQNTSVIASATQFNVWKVQLEKAASASSWGQPGTWNNLYQGFIERFPQKWDSAGNFGYVETTAVDLYGILSQKKLLSPFEQDVLNLNPNFLYMLNEGQGSQVFADLANKRGNITIVNQSASATVQPGQTATTGDNAPTTDGAALTGIFLGAPQVCVNTSPGSNTSFGPAGGGGLTIPPDPATGAVGPPLSGGWMRIIAARATTFPNGSDSFPTLWACANPNQNYGYSVVGNTGGHISYELANAPAFPSVNLPITFTNPSGTAIVDSDWHLYLIGYDQASKTIYCSVDGQAFTTSVQASDLTVVNRSLWLDLIGASFTQTGTLIDPWMGQVAQAAEFGFLLTLTQWQNLYESWRNAWAYERSDVRFSRVLQWAGYGNIGGRLSVGQTTKYGPATDVAGASVLSLLQNIADTENGQTFIGGDGVPVLQSRADRWSKTATITFGENEAGGELPYDDCAFDFDPTRVANDVTVTQVYSNAPVRVPPDATSVGKYGQVTLGRDVNTMDSVEALNAAQYLLFKYKDPTLRVEALPFTPSANTNLWATLLGLELGMCCTVVRRPPNAPPVSLTGFVEQIRFEIDADTKVATWTVQLSNNSRQSFAVLDSATFGRLGADGNTLNATITTGASSLAIATAAGKPTFSTASGDYPMTIQLDGEQITLNAAPGGATSPQTFSSLTRGVNNTNAAGHTAGAVVSVIGAAVLGY